MTQQETPLYSEHVRLGAKMAPFAGFNMPVSYKGIIEEHQCVRNHVGIFDVSHMGEFLLKGSGSVDFLNYVTTGNFSTLKDGKARYTILCNENGGVIDDIIVYRFKEDDMLICVNASNIDKDWNHLSSIASNYAVSLENISSQTGLIAVQGPSAPAVMTLIFPQEVASMKPFSVLKLMVQNQKVIIASTGYTGEKGYEVFIPNVLTSFLWNQLLEKGESLNIQPIGLGARDTLRLEKKYPLYGNDLNDEISPVEADLLRFIDDSKDQYLGKDRIHREIVNGPDKKWVALKVNNKRIPRGGYKVYCGDREVGFVSSGTFSPSLSYPIATAYIESAYSELNLSVSIDVRGKHVEAIVVPAPFL